MYRFISLSFCIWYRRDSLYPPFTFSTASKSILDRYNEPVWRNLCDPNLKHGYVLLGKVSTVIVLLELRKQWLFSSTQCLDRVEHYVIHVCLLYVINFERFQFVQFILFIEIIISFHLLLIVNRMMHSLCWFAAAFLDNCRNCSKYVFLL